MAIIKISLPFTPLLRSTLISGYIKQVIHESWSLLVLKKKNLWAQVVWNSNRRWALVQLNFSCKVLQSAFHSLTSCYPLGNCGWTWYLLWPLILNQNYSCATKTCSWDKKSWRFLLKTLDNSWSDITLCDVCTLCITCHMQAKLHVL